MKNSIFALMAIVLTFGTVGCVEPLPPNRASDLEALPILRQTQLDEPGLKQMGVMLINSKVELEQNAPEADAIDALDVDFTRESMLVVALGERPTGGYWVMITGAQREAIHDALYVQGVANEPGENDETTQALTHPCAVAIVPKVTAAVIHPEIDSRRGIKMSQEAK